MKEAIHCYLEGLEKFNARSGIVNAVPWQSIPIKGKIEMRIIFFGSLARGTADARSDVDLLVILPVHGKRRRPVVDMDRALDGLGIARDLVVLTPREFERDRFIPGTIARPAAAEGLVLYERHA